MVSALAFLVLMTAADPIAVSLSKPTDKAVVTTKDDRVTIAIESANGIGAAQLRPGKDGWPKQVRLVINIKGLEGLTLHNGSLRVQTFLGSTMPEVLKLRDGKWEPVDLDLELAPTIRKDEGRIVIDIAPAWLDPAKKELSVQWIDFYRN